MISAMTLILIYRVNFPFLDGDVPCRASYCVYISQLVGFAIVYSRVADISNRAIGIINFEKHFLNFIVDTMNRFPNLVLGWGRFYVRAFQSQSFTKTLFANLGDL